MIDHLWSKDCLPDEIADTAASALLEAAQSLPQGDAETLIEKILAFFEDTGQHRCVAPAFLLRLVPVALARARSDGDEGEPEGMHLGFNQL